MLLIKHTLVCAFCEIDLVKPCQNVQNTQKQHCFKLTALENSVQLILACDSENDRKNWIRCLNLIIQMKEMNIDHGKVNIFSFEKFYTEYD